MDKIETSAEAAESAALPRCYEVHANPEAASGNKDLPKPLQKPVESKSPAQWAYERLIMYIQNFEKTLDGDHEVAMGFTGGDAGVMRIEGMGLFRSGCDHLLWLGRRRRQNAARPACQPVECDAACLAEIDRG